MNFIFEAQTAELLEKVKDKMIRVFHAISSMEPRERERIIDGTALLSGINRERLNELLTYSAGAAAGSGEEDGRPTLMEVHAFCNAVSLSVPFISDVIGLSKAEDINSSCAEVLFSWTEPVNDYLRRSGKVFAEITSGSGAASLEEFFSAYHIFMDSTILCDGKLAEVLDLLISEIKKADKPLQVTVPGTVVECLQDLAKDEEKNFLFGADEGIRNLRKLQTAELLSVRGDSDDATSMSTFLSAFSRYKPVYKMALFTQDEALAKAVQMLNDSGLEGAKIIICRLNEDETFSLWFDHEISGADEEGLSDPVTSGPVRIAEPEEDVQAEEGCAGEDTGDDAAAFESDPDEIEDFPESGSQPTETEESEDSADQDEGRDGQPNIDAYETDIEKVSMLEAELASMLGDGAGSGDDEDDDEGLSDEDDFDVDDIDEDDIDEDALDEGDSDGDSDEKGGPKGAGDLDFSEEDTLIAGPIDFDSWKELN